jgi:hypothetical protein
VIHPHVIYPHVIHPIGFSTFPFGSTYYLWEKLSAFLFSLPNKLYTLYMLSWHNPLLSEVGFPRASAPTLGFSQSSNL